MMAMEDVARAFAPVVGIGRMGNKDNKMPSLGFGEGTVEYDDCTES